MKYAIYFLSFFAIVACENEGQKANASGIFEATEIIVSAEANGVLKKFAISEGDELSEKDWVGEIDCQNLMLQMAQVDAKLEAIHLKKSSASPEVSIIESQAKAQQDQISVLETQREVLRKEIRRLQPLVERKAVPSKRLDDMVGQVQVLDKQISGAISQLKVLQQQVISKKEATSIINRGILSEVKPLEVSREVMMDRLSDCTISNPIRGTVLEKYSEVHEFVLVGKPLYKIGDLHTMILRAYLSGEQLTEIALSNEVEVFVDAGKDEYRTYPGTITWISSEAEFTPKTIQTRDERATLVYAIKVSVRNDGRIRSGMYGEIRW